MIILLHGKASYALDIIKEIKDAGHENSLIKDSRQCLIPSCWVVAALLYNNFTIPEPFNSNNKLAVLIADIWAGESIADAKFDFFLDKCTKKGESGYLYKLIGAINYHADGVIREERMKWQLRYVDQGDPGYMNRLWYHMDTFCARRDCTKFIMVAPKPDRRKGK
jgi:hypothetical protein